MSSDLIQSSTHVKKLSGSDFNDKQVWNLKKIKDCCMVVFYSPTCPHCINMQPEFLKFAQKCKYMRIYAFNVKDNADHYQKIKHDNPNFIAGVPTFYFYSNGKPTETFEDERTEQAFLQASMRICSSS